MADDNLPKAAAAASREEEDADFDETQDDGEDCEATMDEEEALEQGDYVDELKELEDDNELSIEELRRKYGYGEPLPEPSGEKASSSTAAGKPEDYFSNESFEDEEEEEGEDIDYAPPDLWKKEVRVHPDEYQAVIPDFTGDTVFESEPDDDQCKLWGAAGSDEAEAQTLVREFIRKVVDKRVEAGQLNDPQRVNSEFDDEDALFALFKCKLDIDLALAQFPFKPANAPCTTIPLEAKRFTPEEITAFEMGYLEHGKNFGLIQRTILPQRRVGELVDFYYNWKLKGNYRDLRMQRRVILEQRRAEAEAQAAMAAAAVSEVGEANDQNMEGQKESNAGTAQVDAVEGKNVTAKGKDAEYRALLTSTNS